MFCLLWIEYRRLFEYWEEEWGYKFLEQVSHVRKALYPVNVFEEDILRRYVSEGLEKDEAKMKAMTEGDMIRKSKEDLERGEARK
ncbi:MAG: hypothetical protein NVS9B14_10760 [Candidatus Acidiferrum sp.]